MGLLLLVCRLAARDLRRRGVETALLLLAVLAATTTLTLGLVLRDAAADPYQTTREATRGPDVVAFADAAELEKLTTAAGVAEHSGPFPVAGAKFQAFGRTSDVQAIGRDAAPATVDQPALTDGDWVSDGGVVLEASFAAAYRVKAGDPIALNGRSFRVAGVAVTAAMAPYPASTCLVPTGCVSGAVTGKQLPPDLLKTPGLIWLTRADVQRLGAVTAVLNLRLDEPGGAQAFVESRSERMGLTTSSEILAEATELARDSQILLLIGAWLLALLAAASLAVLVGGRMADQTRRVGLLKAVGGTPGLVAAVLLAEFVLVSLVAAAAGLALGALTAPLLTGDSAGLIGSAGTPSLTPATVAVVIAVALAVAVAATVVPTLRAVRSSTVSALTDAPRPPRRVGWLIAVSARLPVTLLLAVRLAARRPRRLALAVLVVAITVSGVYVALILDGFLTSDPQATGYVESQVAVLRRVLGVWMIILLALAAVNAVVIAWATVLDNRHASALTRALGATPGEVSAALAAAQVLPAVAGAILGVFPGGVALFAAIMAITGGDGDRATAPSLWQLAAVALATVVVVAGLTAIPARLGGRRTVSETL
ncbi:FtsX-like permease family protein [Paractinoplanes rishiriensis]|uniref:ABC3 transporter permease C-terminal domain-containing protein n=1 Tax=Paractinoplanes rishiriensis TaxID=1050105 RepID=A0A919KC08_9ACTN|nr:FtsX-like permease family protein [Actinoplanes rishiriensis]GIF00707.1 hypothetical protein Ari01nite_81710 [Actinoplanes rishiriensis]